jgi:putative oxidoreductase
MDNVKQVAFFLLRVVSGLLFMQAGGLKILNWFGGVPAEFGGHPAFLSQIWIGGALELVGGFLVMIGLLTRPVAFILAGEMAVAYFQFHQPNGFWPIQNHGEPAVLLCFIFLFLAAQGGGAWSTDRLIAQVRSRRSAAPQSA